MNFLPWHCCWHFGHYDTFYQITKAKTIIQTITMRFNLVGLVIGQRGEGKSLFIVGSKYSSKAEDKALNIPGVFDAELKKKDFKILIIDTLDHPMYRNFPILKQKEFLKFKAGQICRFVGEPDDIIKFVDLINKNPHLNNTLIVCEDAGKYMEKVLPKPVKRLIIDTKQRNIDLIALFHTWMDVPSNIFTKSDFIQTFKTEDSPLVRKNNMRLFDKVFAAWTEVQNNPKKFSTKYIDTRTN